MDNNQGKNINVSSAAEMSAKITADINGIIIENETVVSLCKCN